MDMRRCARPVNLRKRPSHNCGLVEPPGKCHNPSPCIMKIWQLPLLFCVCALLLPCRIEAREATLPLSRRQPVQALANVPQITVGPTDVAAELASDRKIGVTTPLRIASPAIVEITPATHGVWEAVAGGRIWRTRILSEGATDLNLGFSRFQLPEGATLHLSSETEDYTQGAFTARDNKPHGQLWTPMVPGDRLVLEMFVPADANEPELVLSQINCGYRDLFHRRNQAGTPKDAGGCNNDVICPAGQPWTNEIRSVAVYTLNGSFTCTGTLINDVAGDKRNFFLTASHCGISAANAATVVVYWNFQSPVCGQRSGGSLDQTQSGATFRMAKSDVDVTLIELEDIPDLNFRVYYSGWDRSGVAPAGAVGIHHPNTDEKSISFSTSNLTTIPSCIVDGAVAPTHWQVYWNSGVTEPGSSGSGIWDPATHKLVGTLSGGDSLCDTPFAPDCYGKFSVAWTNGTSALTRLRDWLDPANTGMAAVPGLDPLLTRLPMITSAILTSESCSNGVIDPGETVTMSFTITNAADLPMTNLVATLQSGNGVSLPSGPQIYGVLAKGTNISRSFTFNATGACGGLIVTRLQLQDGATDLGLFTNTFSLGVPNVIFAENFDGLVAPAIPAGWTNFKTGTSFFWITTNGTSGALSNSLWARDAASTTDVHITSAPIFIATTNAQVAFRHKYAFEVPAGYDGGVLEIAIGAGTFTDITNGGSFLANGYTTLISTNFGNPLAGRMAWSGAIPNFITTVARLPQSAAGQNVRFRWRAGTDRSVGAQGWFVDSLMVADGAACCVPPIAPTIVALRRVTNGGSAAIAFSFASIAGQPYQVEYKGSLNMSNWQTVQTIIGDGTLKSFTNDLTATNRFFRLRSP